MNMETIRRAVVLCCDALPLRLLGCYGSFESYTPNLDTFASQAITFDYAFPSDLDPQNWLRTVEQATGATPLLFPREATPGRSDPTISRGTVGLEPMPNDAVDTEANDTSGPTHAPACFSALSDYLEWRLANPMISHTAWLRLRPLPAAPTALDDLQEFVERTAGHLAEFDETLGGFFEIYQQFPGADDDFLALTADRGYALGERGQFGADPRTPWEETLHVPLIASFPGSRAGLRPRRLIQPIHLANALKAFHAGEDFHTRFTAGAEQSITNVKDGCRVVQSMVAKLVVEGDPLTESSMQYFVKPEDRWDRNNLIQQYHEAARELAAQLG